MREQIRLDRVSFSYPESSDFVFRELTIGLPGGVVSLVGQNGSGKSTLLLLAGAVLLPTEGKVYIQGIDTEALRDEQPRHRYVSFIYQNMEFETEEPIGDLLIQVYEGGFHENKSEAFMRTLIDVFELQAFLNRKTQELSKGELQRTILAFSLLYGSRLVMMDEPIFALEDYQKERVMEFLCTHARQSGLTIYYSVHELDISQRYSDYVLLFGTDSEPRIGLTEEIFTRRQIEETYEVPYDMLKRREALYRKRLMLLHRYWNIADN